MYSPEQARRQVSAGERLAGREVALAPLDDDCLVDGELHEGIRQRLLRIRELPCRSVATLLGVIRRDGLVQLAWEAVEGPSLETLLRDPSTSPSILRNTLDGLRRAVQSLHQLGLVHGDLHAENVVVARGGVVLTRLSPLLHHDPRIDLDALRLIETRANARLPTRDDTSVTRVTPGDLPDVTPGDPPRGPRDDPDAPNDSSRDWLGIVAVLALGGLLSLTAWWLTRSGD